MATPSWLKALDFTNPSAPLGGLTRTAISSVPGGSDVLGAVDSVNARRPTDRSGAAPDAQREAPAGWRSWLTTSTAVIAAGVAALGVVLFLVFRRK